MQYDPRNHCLKCVLHQSAFSNFAIGNVSVNSFHISTRKFPCVPSPFLHCAPHEPCLPHWSSFSAPRERPSRNTHLPGKASNRNCSVVAASRICKWTAASDQSADCGSAIEQTSMIHLGHCRSMCR